MCVTNTPHLNFSGDAREALEFYHSVFGGQMMIATYGQFGVPQDSPDGEPGTLGPVDADSPDADRVAFGMVAAGNGFRLAAYDVFGANGGGIASAAGADRPPRRRPTHNEPFFLLLNGDTLGEINMLWNKLADGATMIAPLAPAQSRHRPTECSPTASASPGSSASTPPTDHPGGGREATLWPASAASCLAASAASLFTIWRRAQTGQICKRQRKARVHEQAAQNESLFVSRVSVGLFPVA